MTNNVPIKTVGILLAAVALLAIIGTSNYYTRTSAQPITAEGEVTLTVVSKPAFADTGGQVSVRVVNKTTGNDDGE